MDHNERIFSLFYVVLRYGLRTPNMYAAIWVELHHMREKCVKSGTGCCIFCGYMIVTHCVM